MSLTPATSLRRTLPAVVLTAPAAERSPLRERPAWVAQRIRAETAKANGQFRAARNAMARARRTRDFARSIAARRGAEEAAVWFRIIEGDVHRARSCVRFGRMARDRVRYFQARYPK